MERNLRVGIWDNSSFRRTCKIFRENWIKCNSWDSVKKSWLCIRGSGFFNFFFSWAALKALSSAHCRQVTEETWGSTTMVSTNCSFITVLSWFPSTRNVMFLVTFCSCGFPSQGITLRDLLMQIWMVCYEPSVSWECLGYGYKVLCCHINSVTLKYVSCSRVTVYVYRQQ